LRTLHEVLDIGLWKLRRKAPQEAGRGRPWASHAQQRAPWE